MACAFIVSHLSHSSFINALQQVSITLPLFIFGIIAGYLGDRFNLFLFLSGSVIWTLMPYFIRYNLHLGSLAQGLLIAMIGLGAIINALLSALIMKRIPLNKIIYCFYLLLLLSIMMINFLSYQSIIFVMIGLVIFGIAWRGSVASLNALVQSTFPIEFRTRAFSIYLMAMYLAQTMGAILFGTMSHYYSLTTAMLVSCFIIFLGLVMRGLVFT